MAEVLARTAPAIKESADGQSYTTAGFEWDMARLEKDTPEHPNPLQGITHLELAKSTNRINHLPYLLETDAGNTLELVTPPYYVKTKSWAEPIPDPTDLKEVSEAIKAKVAGIAAPGTSLNQIIGHGNWTATGVAAWKKKTLTKGFSWRNWSPRATGTGEELTAKLADADLFDTIHVASELMDTPQINFATDLVTYGKLKGPSRVPDFTDGYSRTMISELQQLVLKKTLEDVVTVEGGRKKKLKKGERRIADAPSPIVTLLMRQVLELLGHIPTARGIPQLREMQQEGFSGAAVEKTTFTAVGEDTSYVKDQSNLWLKTDLRSLALGSLGLDDWEQFDIIMAKFRTHLATFTMPRKRLGEKFDANSPLFRMTAADWKKAMEEKAGDIAGWASITAAALRAKKTPEAKAQELASIVHSWGEIRNGIKVEFNEESQSLLGLRHDTYVAPQKVAGLLSDLGAPARYGEDLHVVEVRTVDGLYERLAELR